MVLAFGADYGRQAFIWRVHKCAGGPLKAVCLAELTRGQSS